MLAAPKEAVPRRLTPGRLLVVLVCVLFQGARGFFLALERGGALPCVEVAPEARGFSVARAPSLAPTAVQTASEAASAFLVGETVALAADGALLAARVIALPVTMSAESLLAHPSSDVDGEVWRPSAEAASSPMSRFASAALSKSASFRGALSPGWDPATFGVSVGAQRAADVALRVARPLLAADSSAWTRRVRVTQEADEELRVALLGVGASAPYAKELGDWAGQLGIVSLEDVPEGLRTEEREPDGRLDYEPFVHRYEAEERQPRPPPLPWRDVGAACPRQLSDFFACAEHYQEFLDWHAAAVAEVRRYFDEGPEAEREFGECFAMDQGGVPAQFRGVVWDLRQRDERGCWLPLDLDAPLRSSLNLGNIARIYERYPDQQAVDYLTHGSRFEADLELDLVLCPHLTSLPRGAESVESELRRLEEQGRYGFFPELPYFPCRLMGQGSQTRKLEVRWRRTTECGGPRRRTVARGHGNVVQSLNDAVGIREISLLDYYPDEGEVFSFTKWPKETKARTADKMWDDAIFRRASRVFGRLRPADGRVFTITDDFKDYFNLLALRPSEYWKSCLIWRPLHARHGQHTVVGEYVLGFGCAASSNIAQRFSWMIAHELERRVDEEEAALFALEADPDRRRWIEGRQALTAATGREQCRLFAIKIYTDDTAITVVGVDRTLRVLRQWHRLTEELGITMAIPAKRQIGASVTWLGLSMHTALGVLAVPMPKLARALTSITVLVDGGDMSFDDYRSLVGLLEHLLPCAGMLRSAMNGLYAPFAAGFQLGPAVNIVKTAPLLRSLSLWRDRLAQCSGVDYDIVFEWAQRAAFSLERSALTVFRASSDAAKEGADIPGVGGFMHGRWWTYPWAREDLRLSIPVLEFVGVVANFIAFEPHVPPPARLVLDTDSLTSAQVLGRDAARRPAMQAVHGYFLGRLVEYDCDQRVAVAHIYGDGNPFADMASRGYFDKLARLGAQLGIALEQIPAPVAAIREMLRRAHAACALPVVDALPVVSLRAAPSRFGKAFSSDDCGDGKPIPRVTAPRVVDDRWSRGATPRLSALLPRTAPKRALDSSSDGRLSGARSAAIPRHSSSSAAAAAPSSRPPQAPRPIVEAARASVAGAMPLRLTQRVVPFVAMLTVAVQPGPFADTAPTLNSRAASFGLDAAAAALRLDPAAGTQPSGVVDEALQAGEAMATFLSHDKSPFALKPTDGSMLALCQELAVAVSTAAPATTQRVNRSAWRWWLRVCAFFGTPEWRLDLRANNGTDVLGAQREAFLLCAALMWIHSRMRPRTRRARELGIAAKPQSALNVLIAVRRVHARAGFPMVSATRLSYTLKALQAKFARLYGPEALQPKRRNPFPPGLLSQIFELDEGAVVPGLAGVPPFSWRSPLWASVMSAFAYGRFAGGRRADVSVEAKADWGPNDMSAASISWSLDGEVTATPSLERLGRLRVGDVLIVRPPPAKNDPYGLEFGTHPIYIPHLPGCPYDAPSAFAKRLLAEPPAVGHERFTPLFVEDDGRALVGGTLSRILEALVRWLAPDKVDEISFHALRILLACLLLALKRGRPLIQALCRWKSEASLNIYARLEPAEYCQHLESTVGVDITSVEAAHLPQVDHALFVGDFAARAAAALAAQRQAPADGEDGNETEREGGDDDSSDDELDVAPPAAAAAP